MTEVPDDQPSDERLSTADLVDRYGEELSSVSLQFRRFGRHPRFSGAAVTVRCFEDNALLKATLADEPDPTGKVLVVDGGGSLRSALVGDVIAAIAVRRGWSGLVIYGAVRDSVALDGLELGIKAMGTNPRKSSKTGSGFVNQPVEIGGVLISVGDRVYSDEDGIVVRRGIPERRSG